MLFAMPAAYETHGNNFEAYVPLLPGRSLALIRQLCTRYGPTVASTSLAGFTQTVRQAMLLGAFVMEDEEEEEETEEEEEGEDDGAPPLPPRPVSAEPASDEGELNRRGSVPLPFAVGRTPVLMLIFSSAMQRKGGWLRSRSGVGLGV
jgi:hypothetical protein